MILLPLSWLVYYSFVDRSGAFTLDNFKKLVTDDTFVDPLITTVILATSSAIVCCLAAAPMGWLVARTDMPLRRTVRALVTASFVTPPFLGAIAWELLAAPNSGLLNKIFRAVTAQQIAAEQVARIRVVTNGSTNTGSVASWTKLASVKAPALSVTLK